MRFACAVVGLVAALAIGAQAQQSGVKLGPPTHVVLVGDGCPGLLSAKRQSAGGTMWTVSREDSARLGAKTKAGNEGVYVTLKSARGALREIDLSVSYLAPGARVMPVDAADAKDLLKKTFELSADGETSVDGNLLVGPAFEITNVHLIRATYKDGSVWRAPSEMACSVKPSKYMLVEAKR
jgi:hypothetical protein